MPLAEDADARTASQRLLEAPGSVTLSRRSVLGLAGAAAVGTSPALKVVKSTLRGEFTLSGNERRLAFKLDGHERWVIDPGHFSGSPKLSILRREGSIRVALSGAQLPGTDLSADFVCLLSSGIRGWRMRVKLTLGGFTGEVPLERWLAGDDVLRLRGYLHTRIGALGPDSALHLSGVARATFSPNWALQIQGTGHGDGAVIARLLGPDGKITATTAGIALLSRGDGSLMTHPPARRTMITLERGRRSWPLAAILGHAPLHLDEGWEVAQAGASAFDAIRIEAGQTATGIRRYAVVAEATGDEANLMIRPPGALIGSDGERFALRLRSARLASALDPTGADTGLVARYSDDPTWLHAAGFSAQIGHAVDGPEFALSHRRGRMQLCCEPALLSVVASIAGAVVDPVRAAAGARLVFTTARPRAGVLSSAGHGGPAPSGVGRGGPAGSGVQHEIGHENGRAEGESRAHARLHLHRPQEPELYAPNHIVSLLRPDDLLALRLEFVNFTLKTGGGQPASLVSNSTGSSPFLIVHFPPQHVAEQAFFEGDTNFPSAPNGEPSLPPPETPPNPGQVQTRLAGSSRLGFAVPPGTTIPYTIPALLDWTKFELNVAYTAVPPGSTPPNDPSTGLPYAPTAVGTQLAADPTITAIEAPYRLIVSPPQYLSYLTKLGKTYTTLPGWAHLAGPVTFNSRTELWHTRLGTLMNDGTVHDPEQLVPPQDGSSIVQPTVRAIWATDYNPSATHYGSAPDQYNAFRMSLDAKDRYELVEETTDFNVSGLIPAPVDVDRLMLSSLGAWMNVRGVWDTLPSSLDVQEWRHQMAMGRDQYVRVVYAGFLAPFGHRASLVKVTERKLQETSAGLVVAYLRQHLYIIVKEPLKTFDYPQPGGGADPRRQMPFASVEITTKVTPNLDVPLQLNSAPDITGTDGFWPMVGGQYFQFHLIGTDLAGQTSDLTAPLIFVTTSAMAAHPSEVIAAYQDPSYAGNRLRPMAGQKVALVPPVQVGGAFQAETSTTPPPDPSLEIDNLNFSASTLGPVPQAPNGPLFLPVLDSSHAADVFIPAVKQLQLAGQSATSTAITLASQYIDNGFDAVQNVGEVFAQLQNPVGLAFGKTNTGAVLSPGPISPNMLIAGLSRSLGPVGGLDPTTGLPSLDSIAQGNFDPSQYFNSTSADSTLSLLESQLPKLFGIIKLTDLLKLIPNSDPTSLSQVPQLIKQQLPDSVSISYTWSTTNIQEVLNIFIPGSVDASGNQLTSTAKLEIAATIHTKVSDPDPSFQIKCTLSTFFLDFVGPLGSSTSILILPFTSIGFTIETGKKLDVEVKVGSVIFAGFLSFVNPLEQLLAQFEDPPFLDVKPDHVAAGFTLAIPDIGIGVFSLVNMAIGGSVTVPFFGDPVTVKFNFCTEDHPFIVTVYVFGGGGYFMIELDPQGLSRLEAAIDFGASIALDLVVASGSVSVMAGFKIVYDRSTGGSLGGTLQISGALEVLGMITVSLVFHLELDYMISGPDSGKLSGEASLKVEVDVAIFSATVTLGPIKKTFAGGSSSASLAAHKSNEIAAHSTLTRPTVGGMISQQDWTQYADAFA